MLDHCVVLCGGVSSERDVSLASGKAVAEALHRTGVATSILDLAFGARGLYAWPTATHAHSYLPQDLQTSFPMMCEGLMSLARHKTLTPDRCMVFNALHGTWGEDGRVQAILDALGWTYTGSGTSGCALAMDKERSKICVAAHDVRVAPGFLLSCNEFEHFASSPSHWAKLNALEGSDWPKSALVIKPNDQGSTIATRIVTSDCRNDVLSALRSVFAVSQHALIERYIAGRELTVGIIGDRALPTVEIVVSEQFYDYTAKYNSTETHYYCPAPLPKICEVELKRLALRAHKALGARDYSRIDFRLSSWGQPYFLELNTIPGMTAMSLFPKAALKSGMNFDQLCSKILNLARARHFSPKSL